MVAQLSGVLDGLTNWLSNAFQDYIINPIITFFTYIIGGIFYGLQVGMFYVIDLVQMVVRKVAGLAAYTLDGERTYNYIDSTGAERYDDLVLSFIESPTTRAVFISILVAAVFLLFITTVIAVLKSEFDAKSNAKGPIFGSALKSIFYFALVPVVCYLGIMIANVVLKTLDGATSRDAATFSSQVFCASAYTANRARTDLDFAKKVWENGNSFIPGMSGIQFAAGSEFDTQAQEKVAMAIDQAFRSNAIPLNVKSGQSSTASVQIKYGFTNATVNFSTFDVRNFNLVYYYYDMMPSGYNYLIGYVSGITVMFLLLTLLIGVIRRLFELTILFVVSPAVVSLMPLDGGDRFKTWKDMFIKRVFSAYGPIIGLNLVFMVLELLQTIRLF